MEHVEGNNKLRLIPDVPWGEGKYAFEDGLQFTEYASILARAALDTPDAFTIGIFGAWGSGKTSLMHMIEQHVWSEFERYQGTEPFPIPIWFNAWRYEREDHLILPMLATMINIIDVCQDRIQVESKHTAILKNAIAEIIDLLRSIAYGFTVRIPTSTGANIQLSAEKMVDRGEELKKRRIEAKRDPIHEMLESSIYFRSFERLDQFSKGNNGQLIKLIVFVDDLDRCFPKNAVRLLEQIKLVLDRKSVV